MMIIVIPSRNRHGNNDVGSISAQRVPCHVDQNFKTVVEGQGICRGELEYRRPQHESARIPS